MRKTIILMFVLLFIVGCKDEVVGGGAGVGVNLQIAGDVEEAMIAKCIEFCENFSGDKTGGPCVGNPMAEDWVCDIAHIPRQDVDNLAENQCSAYKDGRANHFVEVDENCKLIKLK